MYLLAVSSVASMYANMAVEAFSLFSAVADWLILFVCLQLIKGAQIKPIRNQLGKY